MTDQRSYNEGWNAAMSEVGQGRKNITIVFDPEKAEIRAEPSDPGVRVSRTSPTWITVKGWTFMAMPPPPASSQKLSRWSWKDWLPIAWAKR